MPDSLLRLPSLDLLRGFVAVGRRMSITQAAVELCLTQSAVSRQVQALEDALGVKLLRRGHRSIAFTPEGERLFRVADLVVGQLQDALGTLAQRRAKRPVTITASVGMTALWLLPRLGSLQQARPGIDVRLAASDRILDLRADGVDIALRYCPPAEAPPGARRLFGERIVPVAHPSLGLGRAGLAAAAASQVLLEFDDPRRTWLRWAEQLRAAGVPAPKPRRVVRFNQYDQVIYAALAGQGIALGRMALVEPMLRDGRLEMLDDGAALEQTAHAYWLVQAADEPREDVSHVAGWIVEQAAATAG